MKFSSLIKNIAATSINKYKHAAIIFRGGSVLAIATNTELLHAETRALKMVPRQERLRLKLISIRLGKTGELRMAKPCGNCMTFIQKNGVDTIFYSDDEGKVNRIRV